MKLQTGLERAIGLALAKSLLIAAGVVVGVDASPANLFAQQPADKDAKAEEKAPPAPAKTEAGKEQPPTETPDAANAAEQELREKMEKAAKAAATSKEKPEEQIVPAPRSKQIDKPGAQRKPLPQFRGARELPFQEPAREDLDRFEAMSRARERAEIGVIERVAKAHVYRMSKPELENNLSKEVEDILRILVNAGRANGPASKDEFIRLYKRALIKYAKDLAVNNSIVVKINALLLMRLLFDDLTNVEDAVPVFIELLKKKETEDAIAFHAVKGLVDAKLKRQLSARQELDAAALMLDRLRTSDVQPNLFDQILEALGDLGPAYTGAVPEEAQIATFVAEVAVDPKRPIRTRFEAANALGKLRARDVANWNGDLQGLILARTMVDVVSARVEEKISMEVYRWWVYNLANGLKRIYEDFATPSLREIIDRANPVVGDAINRAGEDDRKAHLRELDDLVTQRSARKNQKLAPRAPEIRIAPAEPPQPADASKEKDSSKPASDSKAKGESPS